MMNVLIKYETASTACSIDWSNRFASAATRIPKRAHHYNGQAAVQNSCCCVYHGHRL